MSDQYPTNYATLPDGTIVARPSGLSAEASAYLEALTASAYADARAAEAAAAGVGGAAIVTAQAAADAAAASATAAGGSQTASASSASAAAGSASAASGSATAASGSASAAAGSASAASGSAMAAQTARTGAETARTGAETARTGAETARTGAQSAQTAAESARSTVQTTVRPFITPKTSNPTTHDDGSALVAGAMYYNTSAGEFRVYSGSAWQSVSGPFLPLSGASPMTGQLQTDAGAASAPGLRVGGLGQTGLYTTAANHLGVATNGGASADFYPGRLDVRSATGSALSQVSAATGAFFAQRTFLRNGVVRWSLAMNSEAESGSVVGSDFQILGYDNSGSLVAPFLHIDRETGAVGINDATPAPGISGMIQVSLKGRTGGGARTRYTNAAGSTSFLGINADSVTQLDSAADLNLSRAGTTVATVTANGVELPGGRLRAPYLEGLSGTAGKLRTISNNLIRFNWNSSFSVPVWDIDDATNTGYFATASNAKDFGYQSGGGPIGVVLNGRDLTGTLYGIFVDAASDQRLKQNISPTEVDALAVLDAVEMVEFDTIPEKFALYQPTEEDAARVLNEGPQHVALGVIAQQLREVIPEAVTVTQQTRPGLPEDMHTVSWQQVVPYLVRAIQQLREEVRQLREG